MQCRLASNYYALFNQYQQLNSLTHQLKVRHLRAPLEPLAQLPLTEGT